MCEHKHRKKTFLRAYFAIWSIRQTKKMSIQKNKNEHFGSRSSFFQENIPGFICSVFRSLLLLFLTFSALVANPKKTTLHGGQSRSWSAEQRKKKKKKSLAAPPPPPPRALLVRRKKINNKKSRDASTCLGATQVGVTQVISVRLASVQGFLRLVG